ncbi:hypothetical protein [Alphaproteobacteria bacterium endosymbiont of Tiliacea citrago]|uniref:hypothetical protein n=1 Tax=Alphaproteobacteria bacterium endosymbiont of Tiliacea citrago TaxID=3077944 RepID=UPI00313F0C17
MFFRLVFVFHFSFCYSSKLEEVNKFFAEVDQFLVKHGFNFNSNCFPEEEKNFLIV